MQKNVFLKNSKIKFIYVGDGDLYEEIKNRIEKEKINNIILTGFRSDTGDILNIFDIFLTTALYEGMPYSLIEAIRCGLPIVGTDVIGNNEIISDHSSGLLFPPKDVVIGSDNIIKLLKNVELFNKMKLNTVSKYIKYFKLDSMISKYENLYLNRE